MESWEQFLLTISDGVSAVGKDREEKIKHDKSKKKRCSLHKEVGTIL